MSASRNVETRRPNCGLQLTRATQSRTIIERNDKIVRVLADGLPVFRGDALEAFVVRIGVVQADDAFRRLLASRLKKPSLAVASGPERIWRQGPLRDLRATRPYPIISDALSCQHMTNDPTSSGDAPEADASSPALGAIEVGAAEKGLRYWLAKEAVRQGESRLNAQNGVRTALEARATAITGWAAVGFLATIGTGFTAQFAPVFFGATIAASFLFSAGAVGIIAARPRVWSLVGYEPDPVLAMRETLNISTELEVLEALSGGLADGIKVNNKRLDRMGTMLRWAGWLLICAPLAGGFAYKATATLCGWPAAVWMARVAGGATVACPRFP